MIYLLLSILFNAVLFVIIKLFAKFNIDALQALVVNYFVAFLVGLFFLDTRFASKKSTRVLREPPGTPDLPSKINPDTLISPKFAPKL